MKINIRNLRAKYPHWTWRAVQQGFGSYTYHGYQGSRWVRLEARSQIVGPTDDDYATEWWVYGDGPTPQRASIWLWQNRLPCPPQGIGF